MNTATSPSASPTRWTTEFVYALRQCTEPRVAARVLAGRGVAVFPCVAGAKQPLTRRGFHDATTDLAQVDRWWRRWPEANLGLPTGTPAGVDVVDVDVHTEASGYGQFAEATTEQLTDKWAWLVRTPSGGLHAYFLHAGIEQRSWQAPSAHIDFRGDGGYVIAPPSRLTQPDGSSRAYQVIAIAQHSPAPVDASALRTFLEPPRAPRQRFEAPTRDLNPQGLLRHVASAPEGGRNQALFWAACCMAEEGHQFQAALSQLGEAAQLAGLPDPEIESTIRNAYRRTQPTAGAASSQSSRPLSRAVNL